MFFSKLSSLLVARSVPPGAKARALVALQRLLVRVGGGGADSTLDKHVPTVLALLRLALTPPATAPLRVAAAAGTTLTIALPDLGPEEAPGRHAYAFRIRQADALPERP
jgi:hypothetical protein